MSEHDSSRIRQIAGLSIVGVVTVIGIAIAASLFFSPRPLGGFLPFGWFGGIFLIFIVFWVARWLIWPWKGGYYAGYRYRNAESILRERYAKGEITREQFQQVMDDLKHGSQS